jgi:hypothetical protein
MDRVLAPEVRRNRIAKRAAVIVTLMFCAVFSIAAAVQWLRPSLHRRDVQIARVDRGSVDDCLGAHRCAQSIHERIR